MKDLKITTREWSLAFDENGDLVGEECSLSSVDFLTLIQVVEKSAYAKALKRIEELETELVQQRLDLHKEWTEDCAHVHKVDQEELTKERQISRILEEAVEYFVARAEFRHPDGPIRSTRTLGKFKDALSEVAKLRGE